MKRVPMNPYSAKGRQKQREHSAMSKQVLAEVPTCEMFRHHTAITDAGAGDWHYRNGHSEDAHHILKRSSGGTNQRENYRALCHACHMWIHQTAEGMAWAYENGFMRRANRVEDQT